MNCLHLNIYLPRKNQEFSLICSQQTLTLETTHQESTLKDFVYLCILSVDSIINTLQAECVVIHICTGCSTDEKCNSAQRGGTSQIASFLLPLNMKRFSKFRLKRTNHISRHCSRIFETTLVPVCSVYVLKLFFYPKNVIET